MRKDRANLEKPYGQGDDLLGKNSNRFHKKSAVAEILHGLQAGKKINPKTEGIPNHRKITADVFFYVNQKSSLG